MSRTILFDSKINLSYVNTYVRPRYRPSNQAVYAFYRGDVGSIANYKFIIEPFQGGSEYKIASSQGIGAVSIYSAGVDFDDRGYCYIAFLYNYGYGGGPSGSYIYSGNFAYSPDMTNWYSIRGTALGTTNVNPLTTSDGQMWTPNYTNPYPTMGNGLSTNTEGFCVTNQKWYNGVHTVCLPMIVMGTVFGIGSQTCVLYYNTSAAQWQWKNLSQQFGLIELGGGARACLQREDGQYNVYSFQHTADSVASEHWRSGDFVKFYCDSTLPSGTWYLEYLNRGNSTGLLGGVQTKHPGYQNRKAEVVYQRGQNIFYFSDDDKYGYNRGDCADIRMVYKGVEIDRVLDFANVSTSNIKFKIQKTLNSSQIFDTAGHYYIYYGNQTTAAPASYPLNNPKNIYVFYDSFEDYTDRQLLQSVSQWKISTPAGTHSPTVFAIAPRWESVIGLNMNPYYIYNGLKSCLFKPANISSGTVYAHTTVGTNLTNVKVEGELNPLVAQYYQFIGIQTGGSTICAIGKIGKNPAQYCYYTGGRWTTLSATAGVDWNSHVYLTVGSTTGTKFYTTSLNNVATVVYTNATVKAFDKLIMGASTSSAVVYSGLFDFMRISKMEV